MATWFWWAVVAAVLYGAHQIFTRLAADHIGEGLGGFAVESIAALTILIYLVALWLGGRWNQKFSNEGFYYSALTGICVGAGTIAFFLLFQKGGPLSSVPAILAGGAAIMAVAGILFFREPASWQRLVGITLAVVLHPLTVATVSSIHMRQHLGSAGFKKSNHEEGGEREEKNVQHGRVIESDRCLDDLGAALIGN